MTYQELLIYLIEVVKNTKFEKNVDYKPSSLFDKLKDLLYLEKTCDDYYSKINELSLEEIKNFNGFAKLDGIKRKNFIKEYNDEYASGKIDNKKFRKQYDNIFDYVSVVFLNELGDDFLSQQFFKNFNSVIRNVYCEDKTLISIFKNGLFSLEYIYDCSKNIGVLFKKVLKEFEIKSSIYKKNNINGIKRYDIISEFLGFLERNRFFEEQKMYYDDLDFNSRMGKICDFPSNKDDLSSVYIDLKKSKNWFENQYLDLLLNITSKSSILEELWYSDFGLIEIAYFIRKLRDKDFFNKIVDENGNINDISGLINELKKIQIPVIDFDNMNDNLKLKKLKEIDYVLDNFKNSCKKYKK